MQIDSELADEISKSGMIIEYRRNEQYEEGSGLKPLAVRVPFLRHVDQADSDENKVDESEKDTKKKTPNEETPEVHTTNFAALGVMVFVVLLMVCIACVWRSSLK